LAKFKPKDGNIKFKEATKNMNIKEKIDYTWEYYKWWILVSIAGIFIIFYTINTTSQTRHLQIAVTSGFAHTSNPFQLDDLSDTDEENIEFNPLSSVNAYGFRVDTEGLSDTLGSLLLDDEQQDHYGIIIQNIAINLETIPVFTTLAGAGELDIVITYQHDFHAMAAIDHFKNIHALDVEIPADILLNDHGILVRYLPIFNDYIYPTNNDVELILSIMAGSNRIEEVEDLLNVLLN